MIPLILGALTSRLAGPVATAGCVVLLALSVGQCTRAVKAEHALKGARSQLAACHQNVGALEGSIARQNAEVATWKAEGERRAAEMEKARLAARKEAERADKAADMLAKVKPAGNDVCARILAVDAAVKEIR